MTCNFGSTSITIILGPIQVPRPVGPYQPNIFSELSHVYIIMLMNRLKSPRQTQTSKRISTSIWYLRDSHSDNVIPDLLSGFIQFILPCLNCLQSIFSVSLRVDVVIFIIHFFQSCVLCIKLLSSVLASDEMNRIYFESSWRSFMRYKFVTYKKQAKISNVQTVLPFLHFHDPRAIHEDPEIWKNFKISGLTSVYYAKFQRNTN